ncbi:dihydrofolate reductase [Chloroflexota bacterium]
MIISIIAAMDNKRGIGIGQHIPWRLRADLKHFQETTWGHHIIMGRKTYESIGGPLPGRTTIVLSQKRGYYASNCLIAHNIEED